MSGVIPTPPNARVISQMATTNGSDVQAAKTAVATPDYGLLAVDLKPLLDHYYTTLHWQPSFMLAAPLAAFAQGYVLLNGTILNKDDFPSWAKSVAGGLAVEIDADTFQLKDFTNLYARPQLQDVGTVRPQSLPNIKSTLITRTMLGDANPTGAAVTSNVKTGSYTASTTPAFYSRGIDASLYDPTYQDGAKVVPDSLITYAYAFLGAYEGSTIEHTTYYLLAPDQSWTGQTITLPNAIGYNPSYMTDVAPVVTAMAMSAMMSDEGSSPAPIKQYLVNGQWV